MFLKRPTSADSEHVRKSGAHPATAECTAIPTSHQTHGHHRLRHSNALLVQESKESQNLCPVGTTENSPPVHWRVAEITAASRWDA